MTRNDWRRNTLRKLLTSRGNSTSGVLTSALRGVTSDTNSTQEATKGRYMVQKTDKEWRDTLTDEEYRVLREKGTERAFTGEYYNNKDEGTYNCAACGHELFSSDTKAPLSEEPLGGIFFMLIKNSGVPELNILVLSAFAFLLISHTSLIQVSLLALLKYIPLNDRDAGAGTEVYRRKG